MFVNFKTILNHFVYLYGKYYFLNKYRDYIIIVIAIYFNFSKNVLFLTSLKILKPDYDHFDGEYQLVRKRVTKSQELFQMNTIKYYFI